MGLKHALWWKNCKMMLMLSLFTVPISLLWLRSGFVFRALGLPGFKFRYYLLIRFITKPAAAAA